MLPVLEQDDNTLVGIELIGLLELAMDFPRSNMGVVGTANCCDRID